jgi:hypothetical protein
METLTRTFRNADRDRVVVTVTIGQTAGPRVGTDHGTVPAGAATVSFVGDLIPYRCRDAVACGQIKNMVPDNVIRDLWQRWHLNDMRSHCDHQNRDIAWDKVSPCDETGYRAGTAWLHEVVPADVLDMIRAAMRG